MKMSNEQECPLCTRNVPEKKLSDHHLVPRCRGGTSGETVLICRDCHDAIHSLFSNKQLEKDYNSVDALLTNERLVAHVKWLAKQDINRAHKTKLANDQRRRGRNS
jgi:hypothetical protein